MSRTRTLKALGLLVALGLFGSVSAAPAAPTYVWCCGLRGGCTQTLSGQCFGSQWSSQSACASNCL
jgi:hypothetical protein